MEEMPRLAVIDDEPGIRTLLEIELGEAGFEVRCAPDGASGFELVRDWNPDLVLLDVVMPRIDGISLLPLLRRQTQAPIVMLSARGRAQDKIAGFEGGADLYVSKPFEIPELVALLRSALRRPSLRNPDYLTFADLTVNLRERVVERAGSSVDLTRREFELLTALLREPRRVFTREELLDAVWEERYVTAGVVDTYMSYLRAKVDAPFDYPIIHTVRGVGFTIRHRGA
jgi:DNA-binding response OmpR family regulator